MAEIKSESVADFIPESVADLLRNPQRKLDGTRFRVENYRGFGYALRTAAPPAPAGRIANLERALRGGSAP